MKVNIVSFLLNVNILLKHYTSLTFNWTKAPEAAGYQFQLSSDSTFATNVAFNDSSLTDTTKDVIGLGNSTKYYWHVRSYNNGVLSMFSSVYSFTTVVQLPATPIIISPVNSAINQPAIETLICGKASGALKYIWQVSINPAFSTFIINDTTTDTTKIVTLTGGQKYYWQVSAINPGGMSAFAGPDSFTVMVAPGMAPLLNSPSDNATNQRADTLVMMWSKVSGASGYECQLSVNKSFSPLVFVNDSTTDTTLAFIGLQNLQKYFWRVRAYNAGGITAFSIVDTFTTVTGIPSRPHLISPFGTVNVPRNATLVWDSSAQATSYRLQISNDNTFATVALDTTVADTSVVLSTILVANTVYYWHVSASNIGGASVYSVVGSFTTGSIIDAVNEMSNGIPKVFSLLQNYPNPFNPSTRIQYEIPASGLVNITVYSILGQKVAQLVNKVQAAGRYNIEFNANYLSSGIYFYKLSAGNYMSIKKMILMK